MRSTRALVFAPLLVLGTGCQESPPSSESPPSQPASQPSSLPSDHSTSTTAVGLKDLFRSPPDLPEVVAKVEGRGVSRSDLVHELRQMQVQLSATGLPQDVTREEILAGALGRSVDHRLRELLAEELEVEVEEEAVEAWLGEVERRMEAEPAFKAFLLQAGKTKEQREIDARRQVQLAGILDAMKSEVAGELEEKAKDYYDRHPRDYVERAGVEIWRISIKAPRGLVQRDRDLARARAEEVRARAAREPDDFENLARVHSEGGKAPQGGYLGFVPRGTLDPELEEKVWAAKPGTVLPLWEDAVGFAIHKVGKRRKQRVIPFEEARASIIDRMFGPMVRKEAEARVAKLRDAKKVEILAPSLVRARAAVEARAALPPLRKAVEMKRSN